jgi:recombinational DNA repair ATPase RecF
MREDGGQEEQPRRRTKEREMKPTALTDERSPVELFADSQQYAILCSTGRRKKTICEEKHQRNENIVKIQLLVESSSYNCHKA